jgi:HEAT repeat protein
MAKVYVSSTYQDLQECRRKVESVLRRMGHDDVAMEYYVAEDRGPVDKCLADVTSCDLYLGIFALRYGWVPKVNNPEQFSITEMEYRQAIKNKKPCLIFLLDEDAMWPPKLVDVDRSKIAKLRDELSNRHLTGPQFKSADDLGRLVAEAVNKWEKEHGHSPSAPTVPDFDPVVYYEALRKRYQRLDLDALTPPQKEEYLQLQLLSVFVEQNVRENPPPVELPREIWEKLQREKEIHTEDLPEGITLDELRRAREMYVENPSLPVLDVLSSSRHQHVIIIGDPGSGKSTLARYMMLSLIDPEGDPKLRKTFDGYLPVLIELRSYIGLCKDNKCDTFLEFLEYLGKTEGWGLNKDGLHQYLKNDGPAVVIFDGLDEIFDPEDRERVTRRIVGFTSDYPKARVIVTSRIIGYRRKILTDAGFSHFTLQDLNEKQVAAFVKRWYELALSERQDEARERIERILRSFKDSPSIRQLAGNPMLLTIMAIIGKHQELPRECWKLYDHAASVLIQHWDINKHLKDQRVEADFIGEDDKLELLRRLAFKMQAGAGGLAGNYIHREDLQAEFENYLVERYKQTPDRAKIIAVMMIEQFRERNFILSLYGANLYGFVHRAFLEYFCATAFVYKFEKTKELMLEQLKQDVYGVHWEDRNWHEVLRLICGMIDEKFAGEVIDYLANKIYRPWPKEFGDRPPWNIALAVQCLGEVRNLTVIEQVARRLLHVCCRLFEHGVKCEEKNLAKFLDEIFTPSTLSIGCDWPGGEEITEWLIVGLIPKLYSNFNGFGTFYLYGAFIGAIGSKSPGLNNLLMELINHPNSMIQLLIIHILSEFRRNEQENLVLLKRLESLSKVGEMRGLVVWFMARNWYLNPETLPLLQDYAINDGDEYVRGRAVFAIVEYYHEVPETMLLLRDRIINDSDGYVRGYAVSIMARYYREEPETLSLLRDRIINDPDVCVRVSAVSAISEYYCKDHETLSLLRDRIINDLSGYVRKNAISAIAEHYPEDAGTLPLLRHFVVNDMDSDVRRGAILALAENFREKPEILVLLRDRAVNDTDVFLRGEAIKALKNYFWEEPGTLSLFRDCAMNDKTEYVRGEAISALVKYKGEPEILPFLLDRFHNDIGTFKVHQIIIEILAEYYRESPKTLSLLRNCAVNDKNADVRRNAVTTLADYYEKDPDTISLLQDRAMNDWFDSVRVNTVSKLVEHYNEDPDTLAFLYRILNDTSGYVRGCAVSVLAEYYREDPKTLPLLHEIALNDTDQNVRKHAMVGLAEYFRDDPRTLPLVRKFFIDEPIFSSQAVATGQVE